jgi:hypothetical protein
MSVRAFAVHLGVTPATVSTWDARGELMRLRTETVHLLESRWPEPRCRCSSGLPAPTKMRSPPAGREPAGVLLQRAPAAETPHADAMDGTDRGTEVGLIELATVLDQRRIGEGELTAAEVMAVTGGSLRPLSAVRRARSRRSS